MTAKEYLSEVNEYRRILKSLELEMAEVYSQATQLRAIVYDKDRVQVSTTSSPMEDCLMRLESLGNRYATNIIKYRAEIEKRTAMIDRIDPQHAQILRYVYVNGMSLGAAADALGKSYRHTTRLHGWALLEFKKKYRDVLECPI